MLGWGQTFFLTFTDAVCQVLMAPEIAEARKTYTATLSGAYKRSLKDISFMELSYMLRHVAFVTESASAQGTHKGLDAQMNDINVLAEIPLFTKLLATMNTAMGLELEVNVATVDGECPLF
eukprot:Plantae.Rhodophyta-Palmaria_palmata.ctg7589.p2 GENE.Plantae.Rhodophyta-Palmaria_palmata.ctg7589~~Plantae.Rhodophyta-Palmaria_palmata.ctg7589.p2  ORF type:complete len:121 (+),score=15.22 Plantae.Rhodophyta-Palmaria_palmata.ctg7589:221-583(+)